MGFQISAGYTSTITVSRTLVVDGVFSQAAGTFNGGASTLDLNGAVNVSGGTFRAASTTTTVASDFVFTGSSTFNANSGTVTFDGTGAQTLDASGRTFQTVTINKASGTLTLTGGINVNAGFTYTAGTTNFASGTVSFMSATTGTINSGAMTFGAVAFNTTANKTITGTMIVGGDLTLTAAAAINTGTIRVQGNITTTTTSVTGTAVITADGTGNQTLSTGAGTGRLPTLTINKATGTLTLSGTLQVVGTFTHTAGTTNFASGTVSFVSGAATLTPGSITFGDVTFNASGTKTISGTMTVGGTLTVTAATSLTGGAIRARGNITTTTTSVTGTTVITVDGTGNQTLSTGAGSGQLPTLTINKASGTLTLSGTIQIVGAFTHTTGTTDFASGTVSFVGAAATLTPGSITFGNVTYNATAAKTISGTMTVGGTLTITAAPTMTGGTIRARGNMTTTTTTVAGTTVIIVDGTGNQSLSTGAGSGQLPTLTINKASGTLTLSGTLQIAGAFTYTAGTTNFASGTVSFVSGAATITPGSMNFGAVTFNATAAKTISGTMIVVGTLTITAAPTLTGGTIRAQGNITTTAPTSSGTTLITIDGTGNQTLSTGAGSGQLPTLTINKTGGTLTLSGALQIVGAFTYTAGTTSFTGGSVSFVGTTSTLTPGSMVFGDVSFNFTGTKTISGSMIVAGTMTIAAADTINGSFTLRGNLVSNDSTVLGNATILFNGTGNQDISGLDLPDGDLTITKTSGSITLGDDLTLNGAGQDVLMTSGAIETGGRAITVPGVVQITGGVLYNGGTINGALSLSTGGSLNFYMSGLTVGSFDAVVVTGALTLGSGARLELDVDVLPTGGTSSAIVSYGSSTGTFSVIDLLNNSVGYVATAQYATPAGAISLLFNSAPTPNASPDVTVDEDPPDTLVDLFQWFDDREDPDQNLVFTVESNTGPQLFSSVSIDAAAGLLQLVHAPNENGEAYITLRATDTGGLYAEATFRVVANAINDAPTIITNVGLSVDEGSSAGLNSSVLSVSDPDSSASDLVFTLTAFPVHGELRLNGSALWQGSTFTQEDIDNGRVDYTHDGSDTANDAFTFSVSDGAGGLVSDSTFALIILPVNDPPVLTANSLTITEGGTVTLSTSDLNALDSDNDASQLTFIVSDLSSGFFRIGSTTVSSYTLGQVSAGLVRFVHDGSEYAPWYTITVSDGELSDGAYAPAVTFTNVNDAPMVITNAGLMLNEGGVTLILASRLRVFDSDNLDGELVLTLTAVPANGILRRISTTLQVGSTFTQADINAGRIRYFHNGSETTADLFRFTASDPYGASSDSVTFSFTVTSVNDIPFFSISNALSVDEGSSATIDASVLLAYDPDNTPTQLVYTLTNIPIIGMLQFDGVMMSPGATFTQDDIDNGRLTYAHDGSENWTDEFRFTVSDGAGGYISESAFSFSINSVNDSPFITANTGTSLNEGAGTTVTSSMLNLTDPDGGTDQIVFTLTTAMTHGVLLLNGNTLEVGATFTQQDIDEARLTYIHDGSESIEDSFAFTVTDGAGGQTGEASFALTVIPVNDAPSISVNTGLRVNEGSSGLLSASALRTTDADDNASAIVYTISALPASGVLRMNGVVLVVGATFTQADLNAGRVSYSNNGSETLADYIGFTVRDAAGVSAGPGVVSITIRPVNDAPTDLSFVAGPLIENPANGATVAIVSGADADLSDSLTYSLLDNANGRFSIDRNTGIIRVLDRSLINFEARATHTVIVRVTDLAGAVYDESFVVVIADANEAPVGSGLVAQSATEDAAFEFTLPSGAFSDPDSADELFFVASRADGSGLPAWLTFDPLARRFRGTPREGDDGQLDVLVSVRDRVGLQARAAFRLIVGEVNDAPQLSSIAFAIDENLAEGMIVGEVLGFDPDAGDWLTYSIIDDNGTFAMNASTSMITVANPSRLNYEAVRSFTLLVRVTDNAGASSAAIATINLNDLNEPPSAESQRVMLSSWPAAGDVLGIILASDPDTGNLLTFSILSGNEDAAVSLDPLTGLLIVLNPDALQMHQSRSLLTQFRDNAALASWALASFHIVMSVQVVELDKADVAQLEVLIAPLSPSVNVPELDIVESPHLSLYVSPPALIVHTPAPLRAEVWLYAPPLSADNAETAKPHPDECEDNAAAPIDEVEVSSVDEDIATDELVETHEQAPSEIPEHSPEPQSPPSEPPAPPQDPEPSPERSLDEQISAGATQNSQDPATASLAYSCLFTLFDATRDTQRKTTHASKAHLAMRNQR